MNLVVSAITMVDLTHKEAKKVHFQSGKNLLTSGSNHLGKSVVMKSIFYTLGAEVFYPEPIKRINLMTFIDGHLPEASGRIWYEADINYTAGFRTRHRILYSNDGLVFVTYDHYDTFYEII